MKRKLVGFFLIFILWVIYRIFGIENSEFVIDSNDSFSEEYTDLNHFKTFYDNPFVITRDELPQF